MKSQGFKAGIARRVITPTTKVELAGLGYYLERYWERVRDDINATALVITGSNDKSVAIVALDLMYNDEAFTASIRQPNRRHKRLVERSRPLRRWPTRTVAIALWRQRI